MTNIKEIKTGAFRPGIDSIGLGTHNRVMGKASPSTGADSWFSRYSQSPPNIVLDDEVDEDEDMILENRVYENGEYCLIETLNNLLEQPDYVTPYRVMADKINQASQKRKENVRNLDSLEDMVDDPIDEMSAGGVAGVAVPLGYTSKGKPETKSQRKKRQKFNREKTYPLGENYIIKNCGGMQMKTIMKEWRTFLREAALGFGSGGFSELGNMTFRIGEGAYGDPAIFALDENKRQIGYVELDSTYVGDCGIYMTHSEIDDPSSGSFGPLLYDLAIELGTLLGSGVTSTADPSGFHGTNSEKSKSVAINVWTYYYKKRSDITKFPLTCAAMLNGRFLQHEGRYVFPDHDYSHMITNTIKNGREYTHKNPPSHLLDRVNAINHVYSKEPIFLEKLKEIGKLEDPDNIFGSFGF